MCRSHDDFQIIMPQDTLQSQNIAAIDHKMAGKCVTQHMGKLSHRQLNTGAFNGLLACASTAGEHCSHIPMLGMMGKNLILHVLVDFLSSTSSTAICSLVR